MRQSHDPLGIRAGSRFVMERARHVRIDDRAVDRVATEIVDHPIPTQAGSWVEDHLGTHQLSDETLANYVLVLDALNFYFWGKPRWKVKYEGATQNGYWALTAALRRALDEGYPITEAEYLSRIPAADVAHILRGESIIPEFAARVHNLREVGQALLRECDGKFLSCIERPDQSAPALLREVITLFPCFVDVRHYDGRTIPFYKRAQILISDLAAAFAPQDRSIFDDISFLTAFADYKVPQVLHQLGVLRYTSSLMETLRQMSIVPAGSNLEVEIRAATIMSVDKIAGRTRTTSVAVPDYAVDWYLWELGQSIRNDQLPYHRTPTIAY